MQEDASSLVAEENEEEVNETNEAVVEINSEIGLIEAVLFMESEVISVATLSKITGLSTAVVEECLVGLEEKYSDPDTGIELSKIMGGYVLTPKKEFFNAVKERYGKKNEGRLSKSAMETLAIIAYSQPITRAEIESIRHVKVDTMMRLLMDRKFIKEVGKKDIPGKPTMYGTTNEFLEFFHLQSLKELPRLEKNENERFETAR